MTIRPFEIEDGMAIKDRVREPGRSGAFTEDHFARLMVMGRAFTCEHKGKPIACGGFIPVDDWQYCWMIYSAVPSCFTMGRAVLKIKRFFDRQSYLHYYTTIDESWESGRSYLAHMGFCLRSIQAGKCIFIRER
jgi:hypothetical protein